jgi:cell division protein DivIC
MINAINESIRNISLDFCFDYCYSRYRLFINFTGEERMSKISQPKSGKRRTNRSRTTTAGIVVIAVLLILFRWGWFALEKTRLAQENLQTLRVEKERLELIQLNLREEIENLENPAYIEELAREELGLVRKGEILIAPREND